MNPVRANLLDQLMGSAWRAGQRAALETRFAATLLQARGAGVALTPPHKMLGSLRALEAYGPVGAAIVLAAASSGANAAIIDERGACTFEQLDRESNALANGLREKGLDAGGGLGILCRNHRGLFLALAAGAKLGARTLLLNTDFSGPQLADVCVREDVSTLIHDEEFTEVAAGYAAPLGNLLAWTDDENAPGSAAALAAASSPRTTPRPGRKQSVVLLTSGTTGTPKGAPRGMTLSLALPGGYLSKIPLRSGRAVVIGAPAFHAWGLLSSTISLGLGNTIVMSRRTDPAFILRAAEEHRADALITVPIQLARLLDAVAEQNRAHELSALRIVAVSGSALAPELATRTMDLLGDVLYNLYGSTEVAYASIATPADLRAAPGAVGQAPAGTTIRLIDADGHEVAPGQSGRIFVGSSMHFAGYTGGGSKETVAGLMSTGDIGHFDDAGRLFVDGRDDDMIVSGGENVFPREIEELLCAREDVLEAAVVGVADDRFGARLRAYLVRAPGAGLDEDTVREYVQANTARYKVPRDVVFLDSLPRNPAGKVVKRELPDPT